MRSAHIIIGILMFALAGCGEPSFDGALVLPPRVDPAASIVFVDPAGRFLAADLDPELFLVRGSKVSHFHLFGEGAERRLADLPTVEADLLVLVDGCRPARVALRAGRNKVRLETGFRLRVHITGQRPAFPAGARVGITLTRRVKELEGLTLPGSLTRAALAAEAFDADVPTHPQYIRLSPDGVVDVLVPAAGVYQLAFSLRRGNSAHNGGHRNRQHELRPDTGTLSVPWPAAHVERVLAQWKQQR